MRSENIYEFSATTSVLIIVVQIIDPHNPSQKTTSFMCSKEISAQHVGFAIGAFEEVNLAEFRGGDDDDKVGQNAIPVRAYCVPGRVEETKNTCLPIAQVSLRLQSADSG